VQSRTVGVWAALNRFKLSSATDEHIEFVAGLATLTTGFAYACILCIDRLRGGAEVPPPGWPRAVCH
jgi:hypothetical protein